MPMKKEKVAKKKTPTVAKKGLLDDVELSTQSELVLHTVTLKGLFWQAKLTVKAQLPETHRHYKISLFFNEKPAHDAIDRVTNDLENGLFDEEPVSKKEADKQIKRINDQFEKDRELCEKIDFVGTVFAMKYTPEGTQVEIQIPDDAIEAINRQKTRLNKQYIVRLEPTSL